MGRYHFNREKLEFTKERFTLGKMLRWVIYGVLGTLVLTLLYYIAFDELFKSAHERMLERETELMNSEYERLSQEMETLNKVVEELENRDKNIYGSVLHYSPVEVEQEAMGIEQYQQMMDDKYFALAYRSDSVLFSIDHRAAAVTRALYQAENLVYEQLDSLAFLPARFPIKRPSVEAIGATVGQRVHPFYKIPMEHEGLDILSGLGTDVVATADGEVASVDRSARGQGNRVTLTHPFGGYTTVYAHLSEIFVRKGQQVKRGAVIARVGSSGMSFTPHLHYEVRKDGKVEDPIHYFFMNITPHDYLQYMATAYNTGQSMD